MTRRSPATSLPSLVTRLAWHILCGRSRSLAPVSKLCQRKQLLWNVPLRKQLLLFSKLKNATWLFYPHIWSLSFPNQIIICLWYGLMGMKCNHLVWFCAELHKKETCEPVTIIETPPLVIVGLVAYVKTPRGLRTLNSVWAQHLSEEVRRRFYKNWCKSKKKAFTKYALKYDSDAGKKEIQLQLEKMKKYASVVRVIAHTQVISPSTVIAAL